MVSKKLHSLIDLIRKYKTIESTNQLVKLAIEGKICTRKTVFNLIPELKMYESIKLERKDGWDHWTFVDVTNSENINLVKTLEITDQLIEKVSKEISGIHKMKKRRINSIEKESIIKNVVNIKTEILFEEQKWDFFESIGVIVRKYKERADTIKSKLRKLNLDLDKAVFKLDSNMSAIVFERILKLLYSKKDTSL